jgi:phage-related protein
MQYEIELYEKLDGECPVLDFIRSLSPKQQAKVYREIDLLQEFGNELHFPHIRKMEGNANKDLWELRIKLASDDFRIIYFIVSKNECVLLNGFRKKSTRTPVKELEVALSRMNDYIRRTSI